MRATGILTTVLLVAQVGCATAPKTFKQDPLGYEREARAALEELSGMHPSWDLREEAIWIAADTVRIRASWRPEDRSHGRKMAEFIYSMPSPMTLQKIEGDNPL